MTEFVKAPELQDVAEDVEHSQSSGLVVRTEEIPNPLGDTHEAFPQAKLSFSVPILWDLSEKNVRLIRELRTVTFE